MSYGKLLKRFLIFIVSLLALCIFVVLIVDPFYHYHKPVLGLKAVLNEKEYQCIGSLRTFDYDSVIVGSSVCENYNNHWFDEKFDVKSIKAIRSYGGTADLAFYLDAAFSNHDIKKVFYNIDPGNLAKEPYISFEETGCPMYLYDDNYFNDIEYLLNKDVLFEKIPYMLTKSFVGEYDEGDSYNWGHWKNFNVDMAIGNNVRTADFFDAKEENFYSKQCDENIEIIENLVIQHPDTEFYFFYPPYSFLWWDNIYRWGDMEAYVYNMKRCANALIKHKNVHMFCFMDDERIVTYLENYMDAVHFSPDINRQIVDMLGEYQLMITEDNIDDRFENVSKYVNKAVNEYIKPYEERIVVEGR